MSRIFKSNQAVVLARGVTKFGDHAWDIAVPLALTRMNPGSLTEVAAYYLATTLSVIVLAPRLSQWFDKSHRLQNVMVAILLQTIGIITVSSFIVGSGGTHHSWQLLAAVIAGGITAKVGSNLSDISLASDWVPTIFSRSKLANVNSHIRRADMFMEVVAPVVAGFLLLNTHGFLIISVINIATFIAEAFLLGIVFRKEPALKRENHEKLAATPKRSFFKSARMASGQYVFPLLLTNACLWFTILTPHGSLLTAYLKEAIRLPESTLGILRGVGALVGVLPTFFYERFSKRTNLATFAAISVTFQVSCLLLSVLALESAYVYLFLGAIVVSRLGLYSFTLAELEIMQRTVPSNVRLEVAGVRASMNYFSNLVLYSAALVWSQTNQFLILSWSSVTVIAIGTTIAWWRVFKPSSAEISELLRDQD